MKPRALLILLPACALLLSSCLSRQIGEEAAYIKHTKALGALFHPLRQKDLPVTIRQWKHKGSLYTIRASENRSLYNWQVEVRHPDGTCYTHATPANETGKPHRLPTSNRISVHQRHKDEQLILTLKHYNAEEVRLHAHNLGYMAEDASTNAASTAALTHAVQQGGRISLLADGKEYRLTAWEQEAMRRILRGALRYNPGKEPSANRFLLLYAPDGKQLVQLPLSEYWPYNTLSAEPGIPTLPGTILAGNYHLHYLRPWWNGVSVRLHLSPPHIPEHSPRSGTGTLTSQALEELLRKH